VLRGLDYLRRAGVTPDGRVAEGVGLVAEQRQPDGRWLLDEPHHDPIHDIEGGAGTPSRWSTLRALRVLPWYSRTGLWGAWGLWPVPPVGRRPGGDDAEAMTSPGAPDYHRGAVSVLWSSSRYCVGRPLTGE